MTAFHKILVSVAPNCHRLGAGRWRLVLSDRRPLSVSARLDEGFLSLESLTQVKPCRAQLVSFAEAAVSFPATVKLVASRGSSSLRLLGDFPLPEEGAAIEYRLREHLGGLRSVSHWLHSCASGSAATTVAPSERQPGVEASSNLPLAELAKEAGWPYHERSSGQLLVDLETPGQFLQATVESCGAGARLGVALYRSEATSATALEALCLYLLEANAALRYVRGFLERQSNTVSAGFEVCIESAPSPAEVNHALAALSVASRRCARELDVFQDDAVAGLYRSTRAPFHQQAVKGA